MNLEKVTIDNFRNITHAEYSLDRLNVFTGPNRQGKTNTILAIYWAMTDSLLDGSKDYASFKPIGNEKAETKVRLEFDGWALEKKFKEKWTKTRGSNEVTMTGHVTTFLIDDVEVKPTEALQTIAKKFGVFDKTSVGKFDLLQAIINPYYLARNDWKTTRKFIVELVGDVSNEDVIAANPQLARIADRLETYDGDSDKAKKFYSKQARDAKTQADSLQGNIDGLQMVKNVSAEDLAAAQAKLQQINDAISAVRNNEHAENPELIQARNDLQALKAKAADLEQTERSELNRQNDEKIRQRQSANEVLSKAQAETNAARNKLILLDNDISAKQRELNNSKLDLATLQNKRERLLSSYHDYVSRQAEIHEIKCPNCGYVLNSGDVEAQRTELQAKIDSVLDEGKTAKLQIENMQQKIQQLEQSLSETEAQRPALKSALDNAKAAQEACASQMDEVKLAVFVASPTLQSLWNDIENQKSKINTLQAAERADRTDEEKIRDLIIQRAEPNEVIQQHAAYEANQKQIHSLELQLNTVQSAQIDAEQNLILCDTFIKAKLEMFNARIAEVFGSRMHFTLIENNIKEGSWSEVCYPSVLDKDTPFLNGSGSEQILAGIYIAECIKRKLGIEDVPYVFDECDKLDTASLAGIETAAQIITTRVDDVRYDKVTLVKGE